MTSQPLRFDIVHAADPRFRGGTSSALRLELKAAARFGLTSALMPFIGVSDIRHRRFDPQIADTVRTFEIPWLTGEETVECDIVLAHHPFTFKHMPASPVRIRTKRVVCAVYHPPFDGFWTPEYDYAAIERNLERIFAAPVVFAPVGPKVRSQFESLVGEKPRLLKHDLFNLIDLEEWPERTAPPPRRHAVIGRHARNDLLKWPDEQSELVAAYPDAGHIRINILGGLPDAIRPWIGSNWRISPFRDDGIAEFLSKLDFYVFFHSRRWVEAFGISIAEAMACGAVTVLDPSFQELFEDGAVYARPEETLDLVNRFIAAPDDFARQSRAGRTLVARKFALEKYPARMRALYEDLDLPRAPAIMPKARSLPRSKANAITAAAPTSRRPGAARRTILFVATNGIGLGHVTRLMAIAERMSRDVSPVFVTQSAGSSIIHQRGHAVDYMPSARKIGVTEESWNRAYGQELLTAIEAFDAAAVVFDSNHPYPGLLDVLAARPDIAWVWIRRGMWAVHQRLDARIQDQFDMVIEPGELAGDEDRGITSTMRGRPVAVSPILLVDREARLPRDRAAAELGVDPKQMTAVVQLGSERNFDFSEIRSRVVEALLARGVQVVEAVNPLAQPSEPVHPGVRRRTVYPIASCFDAVDLMVTNAGYNSFHECIHGGIAAIFVPNEAPEMDSQALRAAYAQSCGLGLRLRATETGRTGATVDLALSDAFRTELANRAARLNLRNGAADAAAAIEELVFSVRTDRPLISALARV